jgi:hypothetical protein
MNPIGRVFLVLNLALAGTFVAFAGTYLERDDDWKTKYESETKRLTQEVDDGKKSYAALNSRQFESANANSRLLASNKELTNQKEAAIADNTRLMARLSSMEAAFTKVESYMGKVDGRLNTAMSEMKAAQDMAIAAEKAKDDAVAAKNESDKLLAEANFKIRNQETDIAGKIAKITTGEQIIREKNVLLDIVNRRFPGIFTTLHPLVTGTVSHVSASGKLITIDLKTGAENLKAGHTFALFSPTDGYKGEAVVNEIDTGKKYCFARLSLDQGKKIGTGDTASTDVSRSGAGN